MQHPKTSSLSNTIGYEAFLVDQGVEPAVARDLCMEIGKVADKINGGAYTLYSEDLLERPIDDLPVVDGRRPSFKDRIAEGLSGLVGSEVRVDYIGVEDLCDAGKNGRDEQLRIYRFVRHGTVRTALKLGGGTRRYRSGEPLDPVDFSLRYEVSRALGTHKIRQILDRGYGHVFSKILKDNIIDLWFGYSKALIRKDLARARHFAALCPTLRIALPVGKHREETNRWIFFIHRNSARRVG